MRKRESESKKIKRREGERPKEIERKVVLVDKELSLVESKFKK